MSSSLPRSAGHGDASLMDADDGGYTQQQLFDLLRNRMNNFIYVLGDTTRDLRETFSMSKDDLHEEQYSQYVAQEFGRRVLTASSGGLVRIVHSENAYLLAYVITYLIDNAVDYEIRENRVKRVQDELIKIQNSVLGAATYGTAFMEVFFKNKRSDNYQDIFRTLNMSRTHHTKLVEVGKTMQKTLKGMISKEKVDRKGYDPAQRDKFQHFITAEENRLKTIYKLRDDARKYYKEIRTYLDDIEKKIIQRHAPLSGYKTANKVSEDTIEQLRINYLDAYTRDDHDGSTEEVYVGKHKADIVEQQVRKYLATPASHADLAAAKLEFESEGGQRIFREYKQAGSAAVAALRTAFRETKKDVDTIGEGIVLARLPSGTEKSDGGGSVSESEVEGPEGVPIQAPADTGAVSDVQQRADAGGGEHDVPAPRRKTPRRIEKKRGA